MVKIHIFGRTVPNLNKDIGLCRLTSFDHDSACDSDHSKSNGGSLPCNYPCNGVTDINKYDFVFLHYPNSESYVALKTWETLNEQLMGKIILFTGGDGVPKAAMQTIINRYNIPVINGFEIDRMRWDFVKEPVASAKELVDMICPKVREVLAALVILCQGYMIANKDDSKCAEIMKSVAIAVKTEKANETRKSSWWYNVFDSDFKSKEELIKRVKEEFSTTVVKENVITLIDKIYTPRGVIESQVVCNAYNAIIEKLGGE